MAAGFFLLSKGFQAFAYSVSSSLFLLRFCEFRAKITDEITDESIKGKLIRANGKPAPVSTYKGWGLLAWADKKEDTP